ncbi:MAG: ribonuclease E/G [Elstera sp.]
MERPDAGIILSEGPGEVRGVRLIDGLCAAFAAARIGDLPLGTPCRGVVRAVLPDVGAFIDIGIGAEAFLGGTGAAALPIGTRVLVQVSRAASGDKPMGVTRSLEWAGTRLSLSLLEGRTGEISISRHLPETERTRLRMLLPEMMPVERLAAGYSVTALPAASGHYRKALAQDLAALLAQADSINRDGPPGPANGAASPLLRVLSALAVQKTEPILAPLTLAPELRAAGYSAETAPALVDPFARLEVEAELAEACAAEVEMPGGARLSIEPTRALVAIDIDKGGDSRAPEALVTACLVEIARHLRLRGLGGLIVIDPPRLPTAALNRALDVFKARLARDPVSSDLLGATRGGLIELTRPHRGPPLRDLLLGPEGHALAALRRLVYNGSDGQPVPVSAAALAWLETPQGQAARAAAAARLGQAPRFSLEERGSR